MAVTNFFGNTKFGPRVENYVTTTPLDLSMPRMFGRRTPLDYGVGSTLNAQLSYSALGKHQAGAAYRFSAANDRHTCHGTRKRDSRPLPRRLASRTQLRCA